MKVDHMFHRRVHLLATMVNDIGYRMEWQQDIPPIDTKNLLSTGDSSLVQKPLQVLYEKIFDLMDDEDSDPDDVLASFWATYLQGLDPVLEQELKRWFYLCYRSEDEASGYEKEVVAVASTDDSRPVEEQVESWLKELEVENEDLVVAGYVRKTEHSVCAEIAVDIHVSSVFHLSAILTDLGTQHSGREFRCRIHLLGPRYQRRSASDLKDEQAVTLWAKQMVCLTPDALLVIDDEDDVTSPVEGLGLAGIALLAGFYTEDQGKGTVDVKTLVDHLESNLQGALN